MKYELSNTAKEFTLFSTSQPFAGCNFDLDPKLLPQGVFASASGIRRHAGVISARGGSEERSTTVLASGSWKGVWHGKLNNVDTVVAAIRASSATRIVVSTDCGDTWSEVTVDGTTALDDMFGNSRFSTDGDVWFAPVHCPLTDRDVLVIQNGTDDVRIYDPLATHASATNSCKVAKHKPITPPKGTGFARVSWRLYYDQAEIGDGSSSISASDASITTSEPGSSPEIYLQAVISTGTTDGDFFTVDVTTGVVCEKSKQAILFAESTDANWLDSFQVEILGSDTAWHTVWTPETGSGLFVKEEYDRISNKAFYAFSIDELTITSFTDWRFTYVKSTSPSAAITIKIYGLYSSGCIPGGSEFAIAFHNTYSRATSAGTILPNAYDDPAGDYIGQGGTWLSGAKVPLRYGLYYYPYIVFVMPDSTAISEGVDTLQIYLRENGTQSFRLLEDQYAIAEYSAGAWAATAGLTAGSLTYLGGTTSKIWHPDEDDYVDSFSDLITRPSAFHLPIPIGAAMASASGRLFVAETGSESSARSRCMISELDNPFRFLLISVDEIDDPSDSDALSFSAPGETFERFEVAADSANNAVIAVTDQRTRVFMGVSAFRLSQPTTLAQVGTRSPHAFCVHDSEIYFVDDTMRLRQASNFRDVSNMRARSVFQDVVASRKDNIVACSHGDHVYFGVSQGAGTTNGYCLVYDPQDDLFVALDDLPGSLTMEFVCSAYDSGVGRHRLLCFASDAKVYEFDSDDLPGDAGSATLPISLSTNGVNFNLTEWFTANRVRLVCDQVESEDAAVSLAFSRGGTLALNVHLESANPTISRYEFEKAVTGTIQGNTMQATLSMDAPSGSKVYALFVHLMKSAAMDDVTE